eukprot:3850975-Rhodomonas_salina.1
MASEPASTLPYLVSVNVCAAGEAECTAASGLQPVGYLTVPAGMKAASTLDLGSTLRYCEVGEEQVLVELRVLGQGVDESLTSLHLQLHVDCAPCQVFPPPAAASSSPLVLEHQRVGSTGSDVRCSHVDRRVGVEGGGEVGARGGAGDAARDAQGEGVLDLRDLQGGPVQRQPPGSHQRLPDLPARRCLRGWAAARLGRRLRVGTRRCRRDHAAGAHPACPCAFRRPPLPAHPRASASRALTPACGWVRVWAGLVSRRAPADQRGHRQQRRGVVLARLSVLPALQRQPGPLPTLRSIYSSAALPMVSSARNVG